MQPYTIIPRTDRQGRPVLVLPDDYPPYLGCYTPHEGHGSMAYDYYRSNTRKPNAAAMELARQYASDTPNSRIMKRLQWRATGRA